MFWTCVGQATCPTKGQGCVCVSVCLREGSAGSGRPAGSFLSSESEFVSGASRLAQGWVEQKFPALYVILVGAALHRSIDKITMTTEKDFFFYEQVTRDMDDYTRCVIIPCVCVFCTEMRGGERWSRLSHSWEIQWCYNCFCSQGVKSLLQCIQILIALVV